MSKQQTPLQKAIAHFKRYREYLLKKKRLSDIQVGECDCYAGVITRLESLLPEEKKFAEEFVNLGLTISTMTDKPFTSKEFKIIKNGTFNSVYKQYKDE